MEQIFIQCFILVLGAGGQEDVAPNILMDDFAVCAQTRESDRYILIKLNCNLKKTHTAKSETEIGCIWGKRASRRAQLDHKCCDKAEPVSAEQKL